jgi:hypothetical protein
MNMNTGKTTRRSLLASLPAIAATVAPATATALSGLPATSMDAELAALDRETRDRIYSIIKGWLDAHEDARTGAVDPVFAAIERHRQAMQDAKKAIEPIAGAAEIDFDDHIALIAANEVERDALLEFLLTEPATIAGVLAALEFASSPIYPDTHEICPAPVLAPAFASGHFDLAQASADWPAMIARHVRRLIETHALLGTVAFGPTVVKS